MQIAVNFCAQNVHLKKQKNIYINDQGRCGLLLQSKTIIFIEKAVMELNT